MWNPLPKVTELVGSRAGVWTQIVGPHILQVETNLALCTIVPLGHGKGEVDSLHGSWKHRHPRKGKKAPTQGEQLSVLRCKSAQYVPQAYIPHAAMQMKSYGTGPLLTAFFPLLQISWVFLMPVSSLLWYASDSGIEPSTFIVCGTLPHHGASGHFLLETTRVNILTHTPMCTSLMVTPSCWAREVRTNKTLI